MAKLVVGTDVQASAGPYSVTMKSDEVEHNVDPRELGAGVAGAIRDSIAGGIRGISAVVSAATKRDKQHTGTRLFNNTGYLAANLTVGTGSDGRFAVFAPPGRLERSHFDDEDAFQRVIRRLGELVPALRDPLAAPGVKTALESMVKGLIRVTRRV